MNNQTHILRPLNDDDARLLLRKFEEGSTSVSEEKALYIYFSRRHLPSDLAPLRGLMAWYENGCVGEPPAVHPARRRSSRMRIIAAAASAAVLIASGIAALRLSADSTPSDDFATIYAGSYVIRNGVKITDPELIREDVLRAEEINRLIALEVARISDPQRMLAEAVHSAVNDEEIAEIILRQSTNN